MEKDPYLGGAYPGSVTEKEVDEYQQPSTFDFDEVHLTNPMVNLKKGWYGIGSLSQLGFTNSAVITASGSGLDITGFVNPVVMVGGTRFIAPTLTSVVESIANTTGSGTLYFGPGEFTHDGPITVREGLYFEGTRGAVFKINSNANVFRGVGSSGDYIERFGVNNLSFTQDASNTDVVPPVYLAYCKNFNVGDNICWQTQDGFLYMTNADNGIVDKNLVYSSGNATNANAAFFVGTGCNGLKVTNNMAHDNAGIGGTFANANESNQQLVDNGTGTQIGQNSWQYPFGV